MSVVNGQRIPGAKVSKPYERILKVLFSPEIGNTNKYTILFSIINPENSTEFHSHDVDEIMYIAAGFGEARVGNQVKGLGVDSVIFAPRGVKHQVRNLGDESLKIICFFSPPLKSEGYYREAIEMARAYLEGS